jgi:protease II
VNEHWRSFRARRHLLGSDPTSDPTLYEEPDQGFRVGLGRTQDRHYLVIGTGDNQTDEVRLVPTSDFSAEPLLISPRQVERQYSVDSGQGKLWILTNDDHVNFRVAEADPVRPGDWTTVIAGSDRVYLRGISSFARHLVVQERIDGLDQIRLRDPDGTERYIPFPEPSYTAALGSNPEYDPAAYRIGYTSMVTPLHRLRLRSRQRHADDAEGAGGAVRLRSRALRDRAAAGAGTRRKGDPGVGRLSPRLSARRVGQALPLCLWRLWACDTPVLLHVAAVAAGSRLRIRNCAHPRRRRPWL